MGNNDLSSLAKTATVNVRALINKAIDDDDGLGRVESPFHVVEEKNGRPLAGASILEYSTKTISESDTLLGDRYLCRGGGLFIFAPSGIGKSVLTIQAAIEFAVGKSSFGIRPAQPLRSLIIQAEDDEGDTIEMSRIIDHLKLDESQREMVGKNTWIEFLNDLTGLEFIGALNSFVTQHPVDLLWINPYTSYLGNDIKDDKANTLFLRSWLNPLLTRHRCAAIIIHHTPKTNFRDTTDWKPSDWMYAGSGAAVLTNWARAILVVDPTDIQGVFRFIPAKRYQRIGWQGEKHWAHSRDDGKLLWVPADQDQMALVQERSKYKPEDLLPLIPLIDPILQEKLYQVASERGFGQKKIRDFIKTLEHDGLISRHKIERDGVKSAVGFAKRPQ